MDQKIERMKYISQKLNEAAKAYYQENREIISNIEYDKYYDELSALERETGIVLSGSPTTHVGFELLSNLPKERHDKPMLSLDKTKDIQVLKEWLGVQKGLLSWKLDGLTIVLTYADGKLVKAVTRGNGEVGEVVTNNVKVFRNVPLHIPYHENLVLRGEAVIGYSDFEKINNAIKDTALKYKNPRNLCSGSVRQLNNEVTMSRNVYFFAFSIVKAEGTDFHNSRLFQLKWLQSQGFDIVDFQEVDSKNIEKVTKWFGGKIPQNDFPADGLVLTYDDIAYGESLGTTAKFPRDSIAFKWKDEIKETKLLRIEWSASRTGLINPIAVFEPVELEGTTVQRASVHNISMLENLQLGVGDFVGVYKANMIIPQISENFTKSGSAEIPSICPVCSGKTEIRQENGIKFLYCTNKDCLAKHIKSFTHFVSRDAMGIDGFSEATIEKFIAMGIIKEFADLFRVEKYRQKIIDMEGFGEKSYQKLINAINRSRKTNPVRFLYSLGIANVGLSNAKLICKAFSYDWDHIQNATYEQLTAIPGIGDVMAGEFVKFFHEEKNREIVGDLLAEIKIEKPGIYKDLVFNNMNFVITGTVNHFKNRAELKKAIEERGGKVTGSVTSKTDCLVNNDPLSNSSKNKKAKELGIRIMNENQLIQWMDGEKA